MQQVPEQNATPLAIPPVSQPPAQKARTRGLCSNRMLVMVGLQLASLVCFGVAVGLSLYIQNTDAWVDWLGWKRTETGDVYLNRQGRPVVVWKRDSELTLTLAFGPFLLLITMAVLVGTIRVISLPVCRWKAEGYSEPPYSLGRIIMPSFYHFALREWNVMVSTGLTRISTPTYQDRDRDPLPYVVVALENFDFFWSVLSPRQLLREMRSHFGSDHLFGGIPFIATGIVQCVLFAVIVLELGALDLGADDPNRVRVPENQTSWYEYPPTGENASHGVGVLLCVQGILTFLMVQLYAYVALSELSEKGYCWKRFHWFKEELYGRHIFNTWPGPKNPLWFAFDTIGTIVYDISDLPFGGEPRGRLILPPWMTRRDDATPHGERFSHLSWCYTYPAVYFFKCEFNQLAVNLKTPEFRIEKVLLNDWSFPSKAEWRAGVIAMAGGWESARNNPMLFDRTGKLVLKPYFEYGESLTNAKLRSYISEAKKKDAIIVAATWSSLDEMVGRLDKETKERCFEYRFFLLGHYIKYENTVLGLNKPIPTKAELCLPMRPVGPMEPDLTPLQSIIGTILLVCGAGVAIGFAFDAESPSGKITPGILAGICLLCLPLFANDLVLNLEILVAKFRGTTQYEDCPAQTLIANQKAMLSRGAPKPIR